MKRLLLGAGVLAVLGGSLLGGCGNTTDTTSSNLGNGTGFPAASPTGLPDLGIFQNPFMARNPYNNIHNDSYLTDSYLTPGPTTVSNASVSQLNVARFVDPFTGQQRTLPIGEAAAQAYDNQGNILTYTGGIPDPISGVTPKCIMAINPSTFEVLAFTELDKPLVPGALSATDFSGAGYFYEDNQNNMVVGTPDGHIQVLTRQKSSLSTTDQYVPKLDYNITNTGGPIQVKPEVLAGTNTTSATLYALLPDKAGNIWFTIGQGIAGYVTPGGQIFSLDLNDPNGTGRATPQSDGGFQTIANSEPVDEGDNGGPSGVYVMTTYNQYRLQAGTNGPEIVWVAPYDHGVQQKSGQVSFGSGTSPTIFKMGGRRFVTIADNAPTMHINVYRAEAQLNPGENRLFAQIAPFGSNTNVSDENSLIVAPAPDASYCDIFCENNFGYTGVSAVNGSLTTTPGFARVRVTPDGNIVVGSVNNNISVPTIVSKISLPSKTVYTYNKTPDGWFLTGLDALDLNNVRFTVPVGPGTLAFNNHYSALSISANDSNTIFLGTVLGLTRVTLTP